MNNVVVCCAFWNDAANIQRLLESIHGELFCIFVDGAWLGYGTGGLSSDDSREIIQSHENTMLVDAPNLIEHQKRNVYIETADALGFDYCLVIDSDEFVVSLDVSVLLDELTSDQPAYKYEQFYDSTSHWPFYRLHRATARHRTRHQDCFINKTQIFHDDVPSVTGIQTRHDKSLRPPEQEKLKKLYYRDNPVR